MKRTLLLVLAMALLASLAAPAIAAEGDGILSLQGAGLGIFDGFGADHPAEFVGVVSLKLLPVAPPDALTLRTAPRYIAGNATLDILGNEKDIDAGVGLPAATIEGNLPVRIGIAHKDCWGWYIKGDLTKPQTPQALSLAASYDRHDGIGMMVTWRGELK